MIGLLQCNVENILHWLQTSVQKQRAEYRENK